MAEDRVIAELTVYERNAATTALADTYRINPRSAQTNAADRAYYKLIDAPLSTASCRPNGLSGDVSRGQ